MNSNYLKFNSWAFNYYIDRNAFDEDCTLAIETTEVDNYCTMHNCDLIFKEIISTDWAQLLNHTTENNISFPKYFGLLALQCYSGAKMHREGDIWATNFKLRFSQIAGFASFQDVELAFRNPYKGMPIQEYIWMQAKNFLYKEYNLHLVIPQPSAYAGRYVQYPKSQIVLNDEDLKEYVDFFIELEKKYEGISESEFQRHYQNNIFRFSSSFVRKNNLNVSLSSLESKIKLKQIFDFYCSGNWSKPENKGLSNKSYSEKESYALTIVNNEIKVYDSFCREVSFPETLKVKARKGDVIMFKRSPDYFDEYDLTDVLELNIEKVWIISKCNVRLMEVLSQRLALISIEYEGMLIYRGTFSENSVPSELTHKVAESFPVRLKGFKLSRKMEYLRAYAPEIIKKSDISISVYCNGNRLYEYDPRNAEIGKYTIRIPGYSSLSFDIVDSPELKGIVNDPVQGWKTSTFSIEDTDYDMQGFLLKGCTDYMPLTINNWIQAQNSNRKTDHTKPTNNLLLKVLDGCRFKKYTR